MSIILLRGFSHCGKDFVGNILCSNYNYKRFAFADSLKKMVAKEFGCSLQELHTQQGKLKVCETDPKKRTYRQILIDEALYHRNTNSDIFVTHCCDEISGLTISGNFIDKIVITDWRYQNELDILKMRLPNYDIIPVHIKREDQLKSPIDDMSEYQLVDRIGDYKIVNRMNDSIYTEIKMLIGHVDFVSKKLRENV